MSCSRLIHYLEIEDDQLILTALGDPDFILFFLNYIHHAAAQLCEIKAGLASPTSNNSTFGNGEQLFVRKQNNKDLKERISTPKSQKSNCFTQNIDISNVGSTHEPVISHGKKARRSKGKTPHKSPMHNKEKGDYQKTHTAKADFPSRRVNFTLNQMNNNQAKRAANFDLSNQCDFPSLHATSSVRSVPPVFSDYKQTRRIKPTAIEKDTSEKCQLFTTKLVQSDFTKLTETPESDIKIQLEKERKRLLQTRIFSAEKKTNPELNHIQMEDSLDIQLQFISPIKIDADIKKIPTLPPSTVTFPKKLERLANFYVQCIATFSVASLVAEIHLLVALQSLDGNVSCEFNREFKPLEKYLSSTANARQFAANVLNGIASKEFLCLFSNETLALLQVNCSNKPEFSDVVTKVTEELQTRPSNQNFSNRLFSSTFDSVPFKPETDNKTNFLSEKAFHGFRKQRDMFYSLLGQWEEQHNLNVSSVSKETVGKIRWLVSQIKLLSTHSSFIRLFLDQMLSGATGKENSSLNQHNSSLLTAILGNNPEKQRQLENRVTAPAHKTTSHSNLFKDYQFFRDFLTIADNYSLNIRLCDELFSRISQIEMIESQVDENCIEDLHGAISKFSQTVLNLRICGNFYGFLIFFPYNGEENQQLSHMELAAAKHMTSSIRHAFQHGHLVLTIPWVVQFLCFASTSAIKSSHYSEILKYLCIAYRSNLSVLPSVPSKLNIFLSVSIGYLFEQENVNTDFFYSAIHQDVSLKYTNLDNNIDFVSSQLISYNLLYEVHWRLTEINTILKSRSSITNRQLPKKIKPSSEKLPENTDVQSSLEANFFRNQSFSLKRTVAFVAERCHSNSIKHICTRLVPELCNKNDLILRYLNEHESKKPTTNLIKQVVVKAFDEILSNVKQQIFDFNSQIVRECITLLVSPSISKLVLDTAVNIAERQSIENINIWLSDRLFDHLVSRIRHLISQRNAYIESFSTVKLSKVLHKLREAVIENQIPGVSHDQVVAKATICFNLAYDVLSRSCGVLPFNVRQSFGFILQELTIQVQTSNDVEANEALHKLSLEENKISLITSFFNDT